MRTVGLHEISRPKQWKTISSKMLLEEGFPVFGANGLIGYYSEYTHEEPTILVTCRGATCGTVNISLPKSYVNGNAMALDDLSPEVHLRYLKYYLEKRGFDDVISGSAQPQITRQGLKKIKIPLPPLSTQKKIAAILDAADAYRQKSKALIDKYDELAQSLFLDMFGDPVTNPKGWEVRSFDEIAELDTKMVSDFNKYGDLPHVGVKNIEKNTGRILNCITARDEGVTSGKYLFTPEHIIYSKIRPNLNKVALPDFNGVCSADAYPIKAVAGVTTREFLASLLRSKDFLEFILGHSSRTNIPKANKKQMKLYKGICPPIELQESFTACLTKVRQSIDLVFDNSTKSEDLFNSLLQRAFKGELV